HTCWSSTTFGRTKIGRWSWFMPSACREMLPCGDSRCEVKASWCGSELKPVDEARQAYEKGIEEGHLSTLAQQYRDGLVNLTIGNVRPGESVTVILELLAGVETSDNGVRFRFPFTLAPCYHAKARMVEAEPGVGELELPDDEFGDLLLPRFAADASGLHRVGFDLSVWMPSPVIGVASLSHAIKVQSVDP